MWYIVTVLIREIGVYYYVIIALNRGILLSYYCVNCGIWLYLFLRYYYRSIMEKRMNVQEKHRRLKISTPFYDVTSPKKEQDFLHLKHIMTWASVKHPQIITIYGCYKPSIYVGRFFLLRQWILIPEVSWNGNTPKSSMLATFSMKTIHCRVP